MSYSDILTRLRGIDAHWSEMLVGDEIGHAAGRSPRGFLARHYTATTTEIFLPKGVRSCFGERAHWYVVRQQEVTHPNSCRATAAQARADQRAGLIVWVTMPWVGPEQPEPPEPRLFRITGGR
jgi:hypothetical protein